jgi:hypothetical protein
VSRFVPFIVLLSNQKKELLLRSLLGYLSVVLAGPVFVMLLVL